MYMKLMKSSTRLRNPCIFDTQYLYKLWNGCLMLNLS